MLGVNKQNEVFVSLLAHLTHGSDGSICSDSGVGPTCLRHIMQCFVNGKFSLFSDDGDVS